MFINCGRREPVLDNALAVMYVKRYRSNQGELAVQRVSVAGIHQETGRIVASAFNPQQGLYWANVSIFEEEFCLEHDDFKTHTKKIPTERELPFIVAGLVTKKMVDTVADGEEYRLLGIHSSTGAKKDLAIQGCDWFLSSHEPFALRKEWGKPVTVSFTPPQESALKPWEISFPAELESVT